MPEMPPIDLRSDTVTVAGPEMRQAMAQAPVGDALMGEDPTVHALEARVAAFFGFRFAAFVPSGTMSNQILIRTLTEPGDAVMAHPLNHIVIYESGALAALTGCQLLAAPMSGDQTHLDTAALKHWRNAPDAFYRPPLKVVAVENTCMADAGKSYDLSALRELSAVCRDMNIHLHIDGARIWHTLPQGAREARVYGELASSLSVCLSKGLGAPVGSVALVHTEEHHRRLKRFQKMYGGCMRQAGHIAAAGLYAMDNNLERLPETHRQAKAFANFCSERFPRTEVIYGGSNIVLLKDGNPSPLVETLALEYGLRLSYLSPQVARAVFHVNVLGSDFEERLKP